MTLLLGERVVPQDEQLAHQLLAQDATTHQQLGNALCSHLPKQRTLGYEDQVGVVIPGPTQYSQYSLGMRLGMTNKGISMNQHWLLCRGGQWVGGSVEIWCTQK